MVSLDEVIDRKIGGPTSSLLVGMPDPNLPASQLFQFSRKYLVSFIRTAIVDTRALVVLAAVSLLSFVRTRVFVVLPPAVRLIVRFSVAVFSVGTRFSVAVLAVEARVLVWQFYVCGLIPFFYAPPS